MKTHLPPYSNTYPLTKMDIAVCLHWVKVHTEGCSVCDNAEFGDEELHNNYANARVRLSWNWRIWAQFGLTPTIKGVHNERIQRGP